MKSLKYFSNLGKALAVSLPLIFSYSCKRSTTIEGTVETNREFTDILSREKQRNIVIDPLEYHKPSFLIDYDVKDLGKDYNKRLEDLSKEDTVDVLKEFWFWKRHDPDYRILFDE